MFKTVTVPTEFGVAFENRRPVESGEINTEALATNLNQAMTELENEGFDIVAMQPVISGRNDTGLHGLEAGWGWGYGYTSAFVIVGQKP